MTEITVVSIAPEEAFDCEHCGQRDAVAYLSDGDGDQTFGYCGECVGPALVAALLVEPESDGLCAVCFEQEGHPLHVIDDKTNSGTHKFVS